VCKCVRVEVICTAGVSGWKNQVYVQGVRVAKTRMYICNVSGWKLFVKGVSVEKARCVNRVEKPIVQTVYG
jgi:hypothetical protein